MLLVVVLLLLFLFAATTTAALRRSRRSGGEALFSSSCSSGSSALFAFGLILLLLLALLLLALGEPLQLGEVVALEDAQHRELGADGLAAARRRAEQHVVVRVHHDVEALRLHRVELAEAGVRAVVALGDRVLGDGVQREQRRVRHRVVGQVQVRDGEALLVLAAEPAVRHDPHRVAVVLGHDGHGDVDDEWRARLDLLALEQHLLVVEDEVVVAVLHEEPQQLRRPAVHLVGPHKLGL